MTMTPEIEAWLNERLAEERKRVLELVVVLLSEDIRRDSEARKQELEQIRAMTQAAFDRIEGVLEHQARRIDRAAHGEPVIDTKMN